MVSLPQTGPAMTATRITFRLPADLAREATAQAQAAGISLNAWLTLAARSWVTYKRREFQHVPAHPVDHRRRPAPAEAVSREWPKVGRNDPCPCGSGRKWKACHGKP